MWPDIFAKRKPTSIGGTPANKFSAILAASIIATFVAALQALSYTPFIKKKIEIGREQVIKCRENKEIQTFIGDPLVQGAIMRKQKEYEQERFEKGWF